MIEYTAFFLVVILLLGLSFLGRLIKLGVAALKDALEYLKERKELKWM